MRGKTPKIVTVILQGFKRLDISNCLIFSFIPQNCFDFGGAFYTPESMVITVNAAGLLKMDLFGIDMVAITNTTTINYPGLLCQKSLKQYQW
jgi:hypothetical protein